MNKIYYVYILTNFSNSILYIGVTGDLKIRIYTHKHGLVEGFTKKYKVNKLVYLEEFIDVNEALRREKQLKNWHREWKINLIKVKNPQFIEIKI